MTSLAQFASTVILAGLTFTTAGAIAVAVSRSQIHRQRVGELTFVAFLAWAVFAAVPLERGGLSASTTVDAETALAGPSNAFDATTSDAPSHVDALPTEPWSAAIVEPAAAPGTDDDTFAWLWLAGAAMIALYLTFARGVLWWTVRRARSAPASTIAIAARLTRKPPRIYASRSVRRPFCCGVFRSSIVLPAHLCAADAEPALTSVLRHELAHLRQRDLLGQTVTMLCWPLLYWNPLYYWLRRETQIAAEMIADDIASGPATKTTYVRSLIDLIEREPAALPMHAGAIGVFHRKTEFYRRMNMLLERKNRLDVQCSRRHLAMRLSVAVAFVAIAINAWGVQAQAKPEIATLETPAPAKPAAAPVSRTAFDVEFVYHGAAELGAAMTAFADGGFTVAGFALQPAREASRAARVRLVCSGDDAVKRLRRVLPAGPMIVSVKRLRKEPAKPAAVVQASKKLPPKGPARLHLSFQDTDIRKVLDTISRIAGINIIIAPEVRGTVTLKLKGVPWRAALDASVRALGYTVIEEGRSLFRITAEAPATPDRR